MRGTRKISQLAGILMVAVSASASADTPVMSQVTQNLDRSRLCLELGAWNEAMAYASTTAFNRPIRYSVTNDLFGIGRLAVDSWSQATNESVQFVEGPAYLADLTITYVPALKGSGRDLMGLATTRRQVTAWKADQFTARVSGSLQVSLQTPDGQPCGYDVLLNTTIHEVGHFLGLEDTQQAGRVMGPINLSDAVTTPSAEEADCILYLQSQANVLIQACTLSTRTK